MPLAPVERAAHDPAILCLGMIGNGADPKKRKVPLLVTAAEFDRTVAPALSRGTYNRQKKSAARTDFHEFKGVSHSLAFEPGWEKVADYTLDWARQVL